MYLEIATSASNIFHSTHVIELIQGLLLKGEELEKTNNLSDEEMV